MLFRSAWARTWVSELNIVQLSNLQLLFYSLWKRMYGVDLICERADLLGKSEGNTSRAAGVGRVRVACFVSDCRSGTHLSFSSP